MVHRIDMRKVGVALAVIAIAGTTVAGGWRLASFSIDARRIVSGQPEDRQRIGGGTDAEIAARLAEWSTASGVRASASELLALDPMLKRRPARRLLDLSHAIAERPTAGRLWLAYADQVLQSGYPVRHAVGAMRMSQIVERRRASTMFQRALIVVEAWERLPSEHRRKAITELALLRRNLAASEHAQMAQVASTKSPEVRAEIRHMLVPQLGEYVWLAGAMGF